MVLHKFSATFGYSFENKGPTCVSRIFNETFSEPSGGPGLNHEKQILFVLFLLTAASCDSIEKLY